MNRYRITLLQTAEGVNLKKDKVKDLVTVLLWADNEKDARQNAEKVAGALAVPAHIGMLEYVILDIVIEKDVSDSKKVRAILEKRSKKDPLLRKLVRKPAL